MAIQEKRTFTYVAGGQEVEVKGYSECIGNTIDHRGEVSYKYVFVIRNIYNNEVLYRFFYTGTVAP